MSGGILSIGLDVMVLIFLGVTIYYALKLSKSLNGFRAHRQEFNALMMDLGKHIEEAHSVIERMNPTGDGYDGNLEAVLKESKLVADELQFINDTSNSLAVRLEGLAQNASSDEGEYDEHLYKHVEQVERGFSTSGSGAPDEGVFSIQDREFEDDNKNSSGPELQSQAEKELYQALQRNKKQASH